MDAQGPLKMYKNQHETHIWLLLGSFTLAFLLGWMRFPFAGVRGNPEAARLYRGGVQRG